MVGLRDRSRVKVQTRFALHDILCLFCFTANSFNLFINGDLGDMHIHSWRGFFFSFPYTSFKCDVTDFVMNYDASGP